MEYVRVTVDLAVNPEKWDVESVPLISREVGSYVHDLIESSYAAHNMAFDDFKTMSQSITPLETTLSVGAEAA